MIRTFEEWSLKNLFKKKDDPYRGWLDIINDMEAQRKKLNDSIASLQKAEEELKGTMFKNLPKERQEEILKKQKENREKIRKQKLELEARIKEVDPYGEEEWNNDIKEWDWLDDEDGDNILKSRLDTITKAKNHVINYADMMKNENKN